MAVPGEASETIALRGGGLGGHPSTHRDSRGNAFGRGWENLKKGQDAEETVG